MTQQNVTIALVIVFTFLFVCFLFWLVLTRMHIWVNLMANGLGYTVRRVDDDETTTTNVTVTTAETVKTVNSSG
ncbi:hypothetical protein B0O99DRAFT_687307 [Bisporella sp. PMI_857]|nr:hypothetical protein B0O99DRAFT_687307 [Bisporella sp. PMI_857]